LPDELTSIERFKMKLKEFNYKFEEQDGGSKINKELSGGENDNDNESKKKKKKKKKNKKYKDTESSSSSESSIDDSDSDIFTETLYKKAKRYTPISQPFYYWWYDALLYNTNSLFVPTFYPYVTPYIEYSFKLP
jgi:hypothetical protein